MKTDKNACSTEPFTLDWTDFFTELGVDPIANPITTSVWTLTGVTGGAEVLDGVKTSIILSGGVVGVDATAKNTVTIGSLGYGECHTLYIAIK